MSEIASPPPFPGAWLGFQVSGSFSVLIVHMTGYGSAEWLTPCEVNSHFPAISIHRSFCKLECWEAAKLGAGSKYPHRLLYTWTQQTAEGWSSLRLWLKKKKKMNPKSSFIRSNSLFPSSFWFSCAHHLCSTVCFFFFFFSIWGPRCGQIEALLSFYIAILLM